MLDEAFPLRGFLLCPQCGRPITGSPSRGKLGKLYHYYHCHTPCKERNRANEVDIAFVQYLSQIKIPGPIAKLYRTVIEDLYSESKNTAAKDTKRIDSELQELEDKLLKIDEKYIDGEISADSYGRLKESLATRKLHFQNQKNNLGITEKEFTSYFDYCMNIFENLDQYYINADIEKKRRFVGSTFPGKIIYQNNQCRTPKIHPALDCIANKINSLENKKLSESFGESHEVVGTGVEPVTSGL
ncbi:zinc ribbon domain-containing protein [bacterium]|nr:zinc ribbon domain-containing protein [bacterium]